LKRVRYCIGTNMKRLWLIVALSVTGCGPSYIEDTLAPGVRIRVIHPDAPAGGSGSDDPERGISTSTYYWEGSKTGKVEVTIKGLHLEIDGDDFGTVAQGDFVIIDAAKDRTVLVNGAVREPGEKSGRAGEGTENGSERFQGELKTGQNDFKK
jgi:hypothetical protein